MILVLYYSRPFWRRVPACSYMHCPQPSNAKPAHKSPEEPRLSRSIWQIRAWRGMGIIKFTRLAYRLRPHSTSAGWGAIVSNDEPRSPKFGCLQLHILPPASTEFGEYHSLLTAEMDKSPLPFLLEVGGLKRIPRTGWLRTIKNPESVADHSFRVAIMGLLAPDGLDKARCMLLGLCHDIPEAVAGDIPTFAGVPKGKPCCSSPRTQTRVNIYQRRSTN